MDKTDDRKQVINIVQRYAEALKKDIEIDRIIIFGSYLKGLAHIDSDIDVAVVSPNLTGNVIENQLLLMKYRREIDLRIEPVPFAPADFNAQNPFVREIIETGYEL